MGAEIKTARLRVDGMSCVSCQNRIEGRLHNTAGVKGANVNFSEGIVDVSYDRDIISLKDISEVIEALGYHARSGSLQRKPDMGRIVGTLIIIVSLYLLLQQFGVLNLLVPDRLADSGMGYGMLFVIGLITSLHCIAMCGGINISQCVPRSAGQSETARPSVKKRSRAGVFAPAFLYNLGRVISYTAIGLILGSVGLMLGGSEFGMPPVAQGILKLAAGIFMVIMGINLLGIFPWARRINTGISKIFSRRGRTADAANTANAAGAESRTNRSPFIVGMLNGLMPCGPLQSMQIVALASGSPITGALSMLVFSLGTVPLMLGLGSIVLALGKKFTRQMMNVGAVLVVVLGFAMLSQGGSLSGFLPPDMLLLVILAFCAVAVVTSVPFRKPSYKKISTVVTLSAAVLLLASWNQLGAYSTGAAATSADSGNKAENTEQAEGGAQINEGIQTVSSTLAPGRYPDITVSAGTPVKWVIDAPDGSINGCNNSMIIQDYGIQYAFQPGENVIEFTPENSGIVRYSCWMGMIRGTITVTEGSGGAAQGGGDSNSDGGAGSDSPDENGTGGTGSGSADTGSGAGTGSGSSEANSAAPGEPVPSGYVIPTDEVATAKISSDEYGDEIQEVSIELTDEGFSPAIVVVQQGLYVDWKIIDKTSGGTDAARKQILIPLYGASLDLPGEENPLFFYPDSDFDFSTADNAFYGYLKMVSDIKTADIEAIKSEAGGVNTLIWPPETFQVGGGSGGGSSGSGASCH